MLAVLTSFLASPAVTQIILAVVGSVASAVMLTLRKRYNINIDATMNAALLDAINRAASALLVNGVAPTEAIEMIVRDVLANRPETAARFNLTSAEGGAKLRGIVSQQVALVQGTGAMASPVPVVTRK